MSKNAERYSNSRFESRFNLNTINRKINQNISMAPQCQRANKRRMMTETMGCSVYSRCIVSKSSVYTPESTEQFSRTTVIRQWVPDWRSAEAVIRRALRNLSACVCMSNTFSQINLNVEILCQTDQKKRRRGYQGTSAFFAETCYTAHCRYVCDV